MKKPSAVQFLGPPEKSCENLTQVQINQLLGCLCSKSVRTVMENHYFTLGGQIYKQTDGGSTGVDMTVEIAGIYMLVWDLAFLTKLKQMGIKLSVYKRYVDDIVIVMRMIEAGWYFDRDRGKLVFNPEHEYAALEPTI